MIALKGKRRNEKIGLIYQYNFDKECLCEEVTSFYIVYI